MENESNLLGNTKKVYLPSGATIIIREQNGEDESALSRTPLEPKATPMDVFLQLIVENHSELGSKPMLNDILNWPLKDRYYALLASRIFSLGTEVTFKHDCSNSKCNHTQEWVAELLAFDKDLSGKTTEFLDEEGEVIKPSEFAIEPYPYGKQKLITLVLNSGKQVRYQIMDSHSERLFYDSDKKDSNMVFTCRNLEMNTGGDNWEKVYSFIKFTSRELVAIRKDIGTNDGAFAPMQQLVCPKCGLKEYVNLMELPSFFFPTEC